MMRKQCSVWISSWLLLSATLWAAAPKTLITLEGDKPIAGMAKSWKKVSDGKYEFSLDTSIEVAKGQKLEPDHVKSSLEKALGKKMSLKVSPSGKDGVAVTYQGDEKEFLKNIAKTRIRAERNIQLALESGVSDTGVRARISARRPKDGEAKGRIVNLSAEHADIWVLEKGKNGVPAKVPQGKMIKMVPEKGMTELSAYKKGDSIFFQPIEEKSGIWTARGLTQK